MANMGSYCENRKGIENASTNVEGNGKECREMVRQMGKHRKDILKEIKSRRGPVGK
jgi:hypothetical protein